MVDDDTEDKIIPRLVGFQKKSMKTCPEHEKIAKNSFYERSLLFILFYESEKGEKFKLSKAISEFSDDDERKNSETTLKDLKEELRKSNPLSFYLR